VDSGDGDGDGDGVGGWLRMTLAKDSGDCRGSNAGGVDDQWSLPSLAAWCLEPAASQSLALSSDPCRGLRVVVPTGSNRTSSHLSHRAADNLLARVGTNGSSPPTPSRSPSSSCSSLSPSFVSSASPYSPSRPPSPSVLRDGRDRPSSPSCQSAPPTSSASYSTYSVSNSSMRLTSRSLAVLLSP
jgi:hypothetical protein